MNFITATGLQSVVDPPSDRLEAFGQPCSHRVIGVCRAGRICQAKDTNCVDAIRRISFQQEFGVEDVVLPATGDDCPVRCNAAIRDCVAIAGKMANEGVNVLLQNIVAAPDRQFGT